MKEEVVQKPRKQHRPWPVRLAQLVFVLVCLLSITIGIGAVYLSDRFVSAPEWLQDRIDQRIAENAPDLRITSGDMMVTIAPGFHPTVQLRDVAIRTASGQDLVAVSELRASIAFRPLLEGKVQPKSVALSGMFATLRRDAEGAVDLIVSDVAGARSRQADTLADLVNQLDTLFERPEMQALNALTVDGVTLRFEDRRARRVWTVDGARLNVARQGRQLNISSDLAILGGGANAATISANYESNIGESEAAFGISVEDMQAVDLAAFAPAFGWLGGLQAPISASLRGGLTDDGALSPINAFLEIGKGVLQPTAQTSPIPFNSAQAFFTLDPVAGELNFDELSIDSAWVKGTLDGRARLSGLESGTLEEMVGQFRLSGLEIDQAELYDAPLKFEGAELDFRLIPDPFRLDFGQVRIVDQGQSLRMNGNLEAAPDGWHAAANVRMDGITRTRLMELWPEGAVDKTRSWVSNNVKKATLTNIELALRTIPTSKPDVYLSFNFEDAELTYLRAFPAITKAKGTASILRNRFALSVIEGQVIAPQGGAIDIANSAFVIPDVSVKRSVPAEVHLETDGTITSTLALLDLEPLNILSRADLPVTVADGRATAKTLLKLPLQAKIDNDDISFDVVGTLRNVRSSTLVPRRRIESPELTVVASNDDVSISGKGTFDSVPVDVAWSQQLGPAANGDSQVTAQVELSNASVTALKLGLPARTVSGVGTGQLKVTLPKGGTPRYSLTSNLRGVGLNIPPLGWSLGRNQRGTLAVAGTLGRTPSVDQLDLDAPGLTARGSVSLRADGGLSQAQFSRVRVGGWLNAPVTLVGRGPGASPEVRVQGGSLDLRAAEFGSGGGGGGSNAAGPMVLALDTLRITDSIALTNMRGRFDLRGGMSGEFSGRINGQTPVTGQVVPQGRRSAFRVKSADAGAAFSAAGLLKQARGGELSVTFQPVGNAGAFNGALSVKNTRITDAPAIAALFNALSVVGLIEQMNGQGLHFAEVEAAFRLTPEKVTLTEASAIGPSIGLSMDGVYDVNTSVMDMRGVFSPLYLINGLGSILTRKGEGLVGFNFRLTGPAAKPRVQVNPLSALTPSIFREIFRRPAPKVALEPGEEPGREPQVPNDGKRGPRIPIVQSGSDR